ncbi:MAG: hypothetical protein DHS20C11_15150 [Lysobacteraceae bacterium]|nr:MAG: hypothetical protein DHS20C11_15150 [Xanthomonadaceae bacterium]
MQLKIEQSSKKGLPLYSKTSIAAVLATTLGLASFGDALATELDERWYVDFGGGIIVPDDDLRPTDAKIVTARFGKHFHEEYALEIEAFHDEYEFGMDFPLEHDGISANLLIINREPLWNPYFLVGIGAVRSSGEGLPSETSAAISIGVGGRWQLTEGGTMLRADARLRYDTNDSDVPGNDGYGDGVFTVSIAIPLGKKR